MDSQISEGSIELAQDNENDKDKKDKDVEMLDDNESKSGTSM